jgi:Flp pilus assembly protein TadG
VNQRGQALPLAGIAIIVLLAAAGFAVDTGYHQYQQRMQQTATDSAALAGAVELQNGDWSAAALKDAANNGYTDNTGGGPCGATIGRICVVPNAPPVSPDVYAGNGGAVEVQITVNHPTFFERVLGITVVPVTTKAVAYTVSRAGNGCIYVLDGSSTANFNGTSGGGTISAQNCGLLFNGGANFNNSTVQAASIECVQACSGGTYPSPYATPQSADPISDPCPSITYCAHMVASPPSCSGVSAQPKANASGPTVVPPGCYNGLTYDNHNNGPSLNVQFCGLYVLTGTANISSTTAAPITITMPSGCAGVTFYITGSGSVVFKNANMNLSAPTTGDYAQYNAGEQNMLFYQTSSDTNPAVLQSATCGTCTSNIVGMMYFPSANLNYTKQNSNTSGTGALIVAYDLNCNGCNASTFQAPSAALQTVKTVVLGE